jgi:ASC-1-like (ASCH) protein
MEYKMKLLKDPFERILSGKKTIEIRLFDVKRQKLRVGDIIEFSQLPDLKNKAKVEIIDLLRYKTFKGLLNDFGGKYCGYARNYSLDDLLDNVYKIYTKEKEGEFGVLGIKIKLLS